MRLEAYGAVCGLAVVTATAAVGAKKPHILFLASDDMRPEMSPYGNSYMKTPNFQSIADDGFHFRRCYVQQALCAPSRTVLLTGRRPDTSRVWTIGPYFRYTTGHNWTTLPQFFKQNGYRAIGHGKIFHEGNASGWPLDQDQMFGSWSVPYFHPQDTYNKYNKTHPAPCQPGWGCAQAPHSNIGIDAPWETFNDAKSALTAIEWINNASKYEEPFFLAVGFHRPHIPYVYPKEFEYTGDVSFPPKDYYITKGVPPMAPHDWTGEGMRYGDLRAIEPSITRYDKVFQQNLSTLCEEVPLEKQAEMKRSYLSCIQYVDHLVGQLVGALKSNGLYDDTTIIFWGDHGYKLGEHCDWFKHDNYEDSTRIPLLLKPAAAHRARWGITSVGKEIGQLVEEIDIFPSLIDLAGLTAPDGLQGQSWVPLLTDPSESGKPAVFSQYPHSSQAHEHQVMGYSMRTHQWRYTEWRRFNCSAMNPMSNCPTNKEALPQWADAELWGVELYDHANDPSTTWGDYENVNLAYDSAHADTVKQLHTQLQESWALPEDGLP
mmetsp:Transcript_17511/g.45792  ORF Transcript_17511/g.45792 Transcript_17511/m.45792 type:complete len:545 (-) Transcript_17511:347-1981(-)